MLTRPAETSDHLVILVLGLQQTLGAPARSPSRLLHMTYMYLRIEFLRWGGGGVGPGHVVVRGHVLVAVSGVPAVGAGAPGQGGLERRQEVVQRPGHDGVVVEGDVESDDANSETDP